jgi:hypothetical protein
MTVTLNIQDATTLTLNKPASTPNFVLICPEEQVSVREMIRLRVFQEVQAYNAQQSDYFQGLVQPSDAERALNGFKMRRPRPLDWESQFERAVDAFEQNGFIVLVDDQQAETLEQVITIRPETTITFLKLIPLVGG